MIEDTVKNEIYNIAGGFEQSNIDTVTKVIYEYGFETPSKHLDFTYSRAGQDVRYAIDDTKLRELGWTPNMVFDNELPNIVKYYKQKFIW